MDCACSRRGVRNVLLLAALVASAPSAASEQPARRTGWAELAGVAPGTAVIVLLDDGRRLERYIAGTTADELVTLDLSAIASHDRRHQVLDLLRDSPRNYFSPVSVEDGGKRLPVVQRFDRSAILAVARPKPLAFVPPAPLRWLLHYAGPCPSCDAAQTALGGETPLPSPLPRRADTDPFMGEILYRAPVDPGVNPLDSTSWEQLRLLLPAGLRQK